MYPINSCDVMTTRWRLLVVEESVNWNIRVAIRSRTYVENFVETPSETSRIRMNLSFLSQIMFARLCFCSCFCTTTGVELLITCFFWTEIFVLFSGLPEGRF
jgi:hypothetical protein